MVWELRPCMSHGLTKEGGKKNFLEIAHPERLVFSLVREQGRCPSHHLETIML